MPSRVAITGLGVVTPAGIGVEAFWRTLLDGRSVIGPVKSFDAGNFPCRIAGELGDFSARDYVPKSYRKSVKVMARDIEIAVAAADLAFRDSGIVTRGIDTEHTNIDPKRLGCNIGAGLICADLNELGTAVNTAVTDGKFDIRKWGQSGMNNLTPLWLLKYLPNMLACHVTIIHGAEGPSNTITCCDASGHLAVGEAALQIASGRADAIIAGGAESKPNPLGLLRQGLLNRLCTCRNDSPAEACRPFDAAHNGTVLSEGGGLLILENLDRAVRRGAKIYAEVVGFAAACDPAAVNLTEPNVGALDLAVTKAIARARLKPDDIDLVVAHGTGVPAEDRLEQQAWRTAMGGALADAAALAVTGCVGSLFAGAGGVELSAAAMAIHTQTVPPTVNFSAGRNGCSLQLLDRATEKDIRYAVTGAFSIGGQSAVAVLKRYEA